MDAEAPLSPQETAEVLVTLIVVGCESLPLDVVLDLRQRLIGIGSLPADAPLGEVSGVLDRLVQRIHGLDTLEHSSAASDLPIENVVAFGDAQTAEAFADDMRCEGEDVDPPVHEAQLRRWTVVLRSSRDPHGGRPPALGAAALAAI